MRQSSLAPRPPTHLGLKATVGAIFGGAVAYGLGYANPVCIIASGLAAISVRIALIDLKKRIILDRDLIAMTAIGVTWIIWASSDYVSDLFEALLRSAAYGAVFHLIRVAYFILRKRNGMGVGDIKLIIASGAFVYVEFFGFLILISCFLSILLIFYRISSRRSSSHTCVYLPFGSMISISINVVWLSELAFCSNNY